MRAVAVAYRRQRRAGQSDLPAYRAALAAYRVAHPEVPEREASGRVGLMIASVAREHAPWFWRGVGKPKYWGTIHEGNS